MASPVATVLTSNKGFADWGEVFADQVVATAILEGESFCQAHAAGTAGA